MLLIVITLVLFTTKRRQSKDYGRISMPLQSGHEIFAGLSYCMEHKNYKSYYGFPSTVNTGLVIDLPELTQREETHRPTSLMPGWDAVMLS